MDFEHGLLLFIIGCTLSMVGFFIAFLIINYNKKKTKKKEKKQKKIDHMGIMVMIRYECKTKN